MSSPAPRRIDVATCLSWVTRQPNWLRAVLIGGLWMLASLTIVGLPVIAGYSTRVMRAGFEDADLPPWNRLGQMYAEGLVLLAILLVHWVPLGGAIWLAARAGLLPQPDGQERTFAVLVVLALPVLLALALYVNAALVRTVLLRRLAPAFQVRQNTAFVVRNLGNFGHFLLLLVVTNIIGQASCCLCGVGALPGSFWEMCTFHYALGQIARSDVILDEARGAG